MPDKPSWYGRLDEIIQDLEGLACPWIERQMIEQLFKVGPRRAQQIMQPCVTRSVGTSGVIERDRLIAYLKRLAAGDDRYFERQRRERFSNFLKEVRDAALRQPKVLVQAPVTIVNQELSNLPAGVSVACGSITVHFSSPTEALEKMLALAMAIGNNPAEFERVAGPATRS